MELGGGCYCGQIRYHIDSEVIGRGLCFCRECQHVAGGGPNVAAVVPETSFTYTRGEPRQFTRADLETPATREFCGNCGTHLATRSPRAPGQVIAKAGTLDNPAAIGQVQFAIWTSEMQCYHAIPEGVARFAKTAMRS